SSKRALKSSLQKDTDDMFFVFLRTVQIADRLRGASSDRPCLRKIALHFILAFAFEQRLRFFDSPRRRPGAAHGDFYSGHAAVQIESNSHADAGSFKIAEFEISAAPVR